MDKSFFKEQYQQECASKFENETNIPSTREIGVNKDSSIKVWNYEFINWLIIRSNRLDDQVDTSIKREEALRTLNKINGRLVEKNISIQTDMFSLKKKHKIVKRELKVANKLNTKNSESLFRLYKENIKINSNNDMIRKRLKRLLKLLKAHKKRKLNKLFFDMMYVFIDTQVKNRHAIFRR